MKKSLLYLFACLFCLSLTVACSDDDYDFKGTPDNPVTSVEIKNGNVVSKTDNGEMAEVTYYNFVNGKLDNIKTEVHYKSGKLADAAYTIWKEMASSEDKEQMSVKKDGSVIKIEYKKGFEDFDYYGDLTAQQLAAVLSGDYSGWY